MPPIGNPRSVTAGDSNMAWGSRRFTQVDDVMVVAVDVYSITSSTCPQWEQGHGTYKYKTGCEHIVGRALTTNRFIHPAGIAFTPDWLPTAYKVYTCLSFCSQVEGVWYRGEVWYRGQCLPRECLAMGVSAHRVFAQGVSRQTPPPTDDPPQDGHCCGRWASYWDTFLFVIFLHRTGKTLTLLFLIFFIQLFYRQHSLSTTLEFSRNTQSWYFCTCTTSNGNT